MIDTKALRSRVLDLAIQGKLTEQLESDGTAEELYQQIQTEKQRLVKEGKIKKEKPLPEIKPEEVPFEIPGSWKWVRLREIVSILGDGIHGTPQYDDQGEYYFINGNNLNDGKIVIKPNTKRINENEFIEHKKELNEATILVSINGTLGNIAFYNSEKVILGKSACYMNLIRAEMKLFLFYLFKTEYFLKYAHFTATGVTIKNVSLKAMNELLVPLSPLAEQKRIVTRVEEIFHLLDTIDEAQKQYAIDVESLKAKLITAGIQGKLTEQLDSDGTAEELYQQIQEEKQRLIKEGKIKKEKPLPEIKPEEVPFETPGSWKWCRLGQLVTIRGGKRIPAGRSLTNEPTDHIYIRVSDMQNGTILDNDLKYVPNDIYPLISRYIIEENDIYIVIVGSTIGKTGMVPKRFSGMCLTENAVRMTPILINKDCLYRIISSTFAQQQFYDKTHQVGQPKLAINRLETALIPLPPLAEQKRIAEKLDAVLKVLS